MQNVIRILFLADTHLGFDLPVKPRVQRRRRGHDFLANYAAALEPAYAGQVDLVVHGGDVFNRSRPHASVAYQAFEPLARVADRGVPVYVVPGNHERSRIPHLRFAQHPGIHIFDRPRTFVADVRGVRVALGGFPSERHDVRTKFAGLVENSGLHNESAHVRLLVMHQCVEGATVGPGNYTFTTAADVIRGSDVPHRLHAILSGHIHRHQVLTRDLRGRPLAAPVLYPGSIERTSIAEADEEKGFLIVELTTDDSGARVDWHFRKLPARPLVRHELRPDALTEGELESAIRSFVESAPSDAVLTIRVSGSLTRRAARILSAANLRAIAPESMNIELRLEQSYAGRIPTASEKTRDDSLELPSLFAAGS